MADQRWDVIVVGAGNAAFCAALAAREKGAKVLMLERAPKELMGGNSRFTAGAFRCVYEGVDDLTAIMPDLTPDEIARSDFGTYSSDQFFDDMFRVTQYRTDGELCDRLVNRSRDGMRWLRSKGMRFAPIWGRQAYKIDGKFKFWGGLTVESWGGGPGLIDQHLKLAEKQGIEIRYGVRAVSLLYDGHIVAGLRVKADGKMEDVKARSVVIACGGFESNAEMRTRYLGPGWELAKVRGTPYNTGDGIRMAMEIGASSYGNWSGCHAVGWDYNAPEFGDLSVGDNFQKHSYPWGIMVNATGRRFVDEGADFRNYTYAKYGRVILNQPNNFAWQIFDKKIIPMLRDEYRIKRVTKQSANTHRGAGEEARRREPGRLHRRDQDLQRGREEGRAVQSEHQGRPLHGRAAGQQIELGEHHRRAAVRGLPGRLRHQLHVRRRAHRSRQRPGDRWRHEPDPRSLCGRRAGGRHLLFQLSGRHRPDVGHGVRPHRRPWRGEAGQCVKDWGRAPHSV